MNAHEIKRWLSGPVSDWIVRIVVLVGVIVLVITNARVSTTNTCMRQYFQASQRADDAARQAASDDRKVVDDLVDTIAHATSRQQTIDALNTYMEERKKNDDLRKANPQPRIEACA